MSKHLYPPLRVGFTSYVNSIPFLFPFRAHILPSPVQFHIDLPRTLNKLLADDALDIALISPLEYHKGGYVFLAPFGIGALEKILSVHLYLKEEVSTLNINLTKESTSSIQLLKVLARHFWKQELQEGNDHLLLIGDAALEKQKIPGYQTVDLAKSWWEHTGRGFVFALLATKQTTWEQRREEIEEFLLLLKKALYWSEQNREKIIATLPSYPPELLRRYFSACRYLLGEKELQGLDYFLQLK